MLHYVTHLRKDAGTCPATVLHSAAPLAQSCHEEARFTFMQKSPNQYEGEQENVHPEHLDVSLPVHASKQKGPELHL